MKHFVSIIFENQLNESRRDIVLDTLINTARVGLVESEIEYEIFESENSTNVLRLPLAKAIPKNQQQRFVETLANKLFDKGHNNFDIELTEATLRRGSRGEEVRALQAQLGLPANEQDGIFGPRTEQALRAFQQRAGIQVDGIAGGQTQAALGAGGAPRNAGAARPSTAPFQPGQGGTTQAPPPAAQPATTGQGLDDTAARATISQQRQDQQAAAAARRTATPPAAPATAPAAPAPAPAATPPTTSAPTQSPRPVARPTTPPAATPTQPTGSGRGDGAAEVARRRADATTAEPAAEPAPVISSLDQAYGIFQNPDATPAETRAAQDYVAADRATVAPSQPREPEPEAAPPETVAVAPNVNTTAPAMAAPQGSDAAPSVSTTSDTAVNRQAPVAPAAAPAPGPQDELDATDSAIAAEPAAPGIDAPAAAQSLSAAMRGFGTDEEGISQALQGIGSQQDWDQIKAAYDGDLLADLRSELNRRDYRRYVTDILQAAGVQESVPARPKGAFMFRERTEWDELFGSRYNKDGSPKSRLPILESAIQHCLRHPI